MNDIKYRHFNDIIVADANDLIGYIDKKTPTPTELPITHYETYDPSKIISGYLTYFNSGAGRGLWYKDSNNTPKELFTVGEYPDGYITNININIGTNTLNIFRQGSTQPIAYKPEIYKHNIGIKSNVVNQYVIFELDLNTAIPPTINELLTNNQLKWDLGVNSSHIDVDNNWNTTYCRFRVNGANFEILEGATRTTWNATDCIIAFDNAIDLLNVNPAASKNKKM